MGSGGLRLVFGIVWVGLLAYYCAALVGNHGEEQPGDTRKQLDSVQCSVIAEHVPALVVPVAGFAG
jgi:hypothetical protein